MNILQKLQDKLYRAFLVLTTPACWMRVGRYSEEWDEKLNELMETKKFQFIDRFTAKLGNFEIWVSNHPYGSFAPYLKGNADILPKRSTALLAHKKWLRMFAITTVKA